MLSKEEVIVVAAAAAYEANRLYSFYAGEAMMPNWDMAPSWAVDIAVKGVENVLNKFDTITPAESHECWLSHKKKEGWVYGPHKNEALKTHPCMVPFDELSAEQRAKDALFLNTVRGVLEAFGYAAAQKQPADKKVE
jgi:hypothetical protein